jgi:predicted short-subunit dehydrogenase-like oxidoreductase (DUF2520 family)
MSMGRKVFIIGCGAVGTSLGFALRKAGRDVVGIYDIDSRQARKSSEIIGTRGFGGALPEMVKTADTVVVTTPDKNIEHVVALVQAEELYSENQIWIHCSGHLSADVFDSIRSHVKGVATMHPAYVFPPHQCTRIPEGVGFAIDGDDAGKAKVREHVALLKGHVVEIEPALRPRYHAAMVMASNYIVTQLSSARNILSTAGIGDMETDELLIRLAGSALDKARSLGIGHSLSGPVRRGDVGVVADHLKALVDLPIVRQLYIAAGKAAVELAASEPGYCQDTAQTLREMFEKAGLQ